MSGWNPFATPSGVLVMLVWVFGCAWGWYGNKWLGGKR